MSVIAANRRGPAKRAEVSEAPLTKRSVVATTPTVWFMAQPNPSQAVRDLVNANSAQLAASFDKNGKPTTETAQRLAEHTAARAVMRKVDGLAAEKTKAAANTRRPG